MQTLAPGPSKRVRGFTLLELLVVMVVISIATSLVIIQGTPGDSHYLTAQARKLSQLLRIAQQQALLKSQEIRFFVTDNDYHFEHLTGSRWEPVQDEPLLRARPWDTKPLSVRLYNSGEETTFLSIQPTLGLINQQIQLQKNHTQITISSRASGQFVLSKTQQVTQAQRTL